MELNNLFLGKQYLPVGEPTRHLLLSGNLVLDGAERYIENDYAHAELFLNLISDGEIDVFEQLRLLKTIAKLYELSTSEYMIFKKLKDPFFKAMVSLQRQSETKLKSYFEEDGSFADNFSEHYAYSEHHAIVYTLHVAREHAICGMVSKLAEQLSGVKPHKGDLYGECSILLQGPAPQKISSSLVGQFKLDTGELVARISPRERDRYGVVFNDLDQFGNRLSLMIAAHNAAAPILQEGLGMKATVEWFLDN